MYPTNYDFLSFWWIIPILMMVLCFFMMRRRWGSMMCGFGPCGIDRRDNKTNDSAMDILDRRYASGEIDKTEYEKMKKVITKPADLKWAEQIERRNAHVSTTHP